MPSGQQEHMKLSHYKDQSQAVGILTIGAGKLALDLNSCFITWRQTKGLT